MARSAGKVKGAEHGAPVRAHRELRPPYCAVCILCFAGLGAICATEAACLGFERLWTRRLRNYELLYGRIDAARLRDLRRLRSAEDILLALTKPRRVIGRGDIRLGRTLAGDVIANAIPWRFAPAEARTFACFVKQDRDYRLHRKAIETHLRDALAQALPRWRAADPATVEVWGLWTKAELVVALRLTDNGFRYRGRPPTSRPGALRPTIAAALALQAGLAPGQVVLDPMCGTGTLLDECRALEPEAIWTGCDLSLDALRLSVCPAANRICTDAKRLCLANGSVDRIVCNPPWGRQYGHDPPTLYRRAFAEFRRVLRPRGRMTILAESETTALKALKRAGFDAATTASVQVRGVWARILRAMTRLE